MNSPSSILVLSLRLAWMVIVAGLLGENMLEYHFGVTRMTE